MKDENEKKGVFGRLLGGKKEKKKSCCCNIELEEIPEENEHENKEEDTQKE